MSSTPATLRLGIDIDGVLSDFNRGYRELFIETTKRDLFRGEVDPPVWYYHRHYGYTDIEDALVWQAIADSRGFWESLLPLPGAVGFLTWLYWRRSTAEIYFITTRTGVECKAQTERWLARHGFPGATVLIARGSKGAVAEGLKLTHMLEDRPENLFVMPPGVQRFLKLTRYNQWSVGGERLQPITRLDQFSDAVDRVAA